MERDAASANRRTGRLQLSALTLDLDHGELRTAGNDLVELRRQAMDVLLILGAHADHVVPKEELMRRVWPNVVVSEDSLVQAIADIRRVLSADGHRLIRTIPRRGYMLVVEPNPGASSAHAEAVPPATGPGTEGAAVARRRTRWIPLGATLAVVAAVAALIAIMNLRPSGRVAELPPLREAPARSLVVLPLESTGLSEEEGWFADAVTIDLTRTLGRWPSVLVIDHGSARKYKGRLVDPREAARELGVRYVIRGNVERNGERVHLALTLVDGESGAQRWSQRMEVERSRLGSSIEDLNGGIARALTIEVGRSVGELAAKMQPHEVAADDLAMRGFAVFMRGLSKENFTEAREIFEQAVSKDPDSVRALAGVSLTNSFIAIMHWTPDRDTAMRRSEEPLARLVSLDPGSDLTLMSRASVANMRNDWDSLLLVAGELIEHYPSNPSSHHHRCSALLRLGQFEEAIPSCQRAIRISPRDSRVPIWTGLIGMNYFMLGQYAMAVDHARQTVAANPNIAGYWPLLAAALALDGRRDEGSQVVKELRARHPEFETSKIPALWNGKHPDFIEGRNRLVATVRDLGLP